MQQIEKPAQNDPECVAQVDRKSLDVCYRKHHWSGRAPFVSFRASSGKPVEPGRCIDYVAFVAE
jgi:hypothetical protein